VAVREPLSAIFTADPGTMAGTSEAQHILANLQKAKQKANSTTVCGSLFVGDLMGQHALVVTTGAVLSRISCGCKPGFCQWLCTVQTY
jgi:hypothetical protein